MMIKTLIRSFTQNKEHMQTVLKQIASNPILVYSKQTCPYCSAAKSAFAAINVAPKVIEVDAEKDGKDWLRSLKELTMQTTVPNIFIGGTHIGGYSDLEAGLESGAVQQKLKDVKIEFKD